MASYLAGMVVYFSCEKTSLMGRSLMVVLKNAFIVVKMMLKKKHGGD